MWWSCATVTIPGRVSSLERPGRVLVARPDWRTRECCWCRPTRLLAANFWTLFAWIRSPKKLVPLTWRWCGSRCTGTDSVDKLNLVNLVSLVSASSSGAASLGRFKEFFAAIDDWGRTTTGVDEHDKWCSLSWVKACASNFDSIHASLLLMLRWIASDWYFLGADICNSNNNCSKWSGLSVGPKTPVGFSVVHYVKVWLASLMGDNPVRFCTDGEQWFFGASTCHSLVCVINVCWSWKTWGIAIAGIARKEKRRNWQAHLWLFSSKFLILDDIFSLR